MPWSRTTRSTPRTCSVLESDEVFQRPAEPVEFGDDKLITCPVGREQRFVEFGSAGEFSGGRINEDLLAAGRCQGVVLGFGVLVMG